jgi:hypothetical protein
LKTGVWVGFSTDGDNSLEYQKNKREGRLEPAAASGATGPKINHFIHLLPRAFRNFKRGENKHLFIHSSSCLLRAPPPLAIAIWGSDSREFFKPGIQIQTTLAQVLEGGITIRGGIGGKGVQAFQNMCFRNFGTFPNIITTPCTSLDNYCNFGQRIFEPCVHPEFWGHLFLCLTMHCAIQLYVAKSDTVGPFTQSYVLLQFK